MEFNQSQGRLDVLEKLLGLQQELRDYNKGVLEGKIKPKGAANEVGIKI